jgi:hypothetical protein
MCKKIVKFCVYRPWSLDMRCAYAPHAPPPPGAPPAPGPRPAPPCNYLPETRYWDSSDLPVRNRLPGGWGGGGHESLALPLFPILIRYEREDVRIRVKRQRWSSSTFSSNLAFLVWRSNIHMTSHLSFCNTITLLFFILVNFSSQIKMLYWQTFRAAAALEPLWFHLS